MALRVKNCKSSHGVLTDRLKKLIIFKSNIKDKQYNFIVTYI